MNTPAPIAFIERHRQEVSSGTDGKFTLVVVIGDYRSPNKTTTHRLRLYLAQSECYAVRWDGSQWHSVGALQLPEITDRHSTNGRALSAFADDQEKLLRLAAAVLDEPESPAPTLEDEIDAIVQSHELGPEDLHALGELAEQTLEAVRENFSSAMSPRKVLAHLLYELHGRYDDVPDTTPAFDPEMLVAGDDVIVDEPKHVSSTHQHGFAGTFVGRQGAYFLVRDQEDNVFSVEADEIFGRDE